MAAARAEADHRAAILGKVGGERLRTSTRVLGARNVITPRRGSRPRSSVMPWFGDPAARGPGDPAVGARIVLTRGLDQCRIRVLDDAGAACR